MALTAKLMRDRRGHSLIELLIVAAIIAIAVGLIAVAFSKIYHAVENLGKPTSRTSNLDDRHNPRFTIVASMYRARVSRCL